MFSILKKCGVTICIITISYAFNLAYCQDKIIYGFTFKGGTHNKGVLYGYNLNSHTYRVLIDFNGANGAYPSGELIVSDSGRLIFGLTSGGGKYNNGIIYCYDTTIHKEKVLINLNFSKGAHYGNIIESNNGNIFGMLNQVGKIDSTGLLYSYNKNSGELIKEKNLGGSVNTGDLDGGYGMFIKDDVICGLNGSGGKYKAGCLFLYDIKTKKDSILISFDPKTKEYAYGNLIYNNGMLYWVMSKHGAITDTTGYICSYNLTNQKLSKIFAFPAANSSEGPSRGTIIMVKDSLIFGTNDAVIKKGKSTLFKYNIKTGEYKLLLTFEDSMGYYASPGNLLENNGIIYGTMLEGGKYNKGTLFSYDYRNDKFEILKDFNGKNGENPEGIHK